MQTTETNTANQPTNIHTYIAFFNGKQMEVKAETSYQAQQKAALLWGAGRRAWNITVVLAQKADGNTVVHSGAEF